MVNISFPETNVVSCVFSLKNGSTALSWYDEYDRVVGDRVDSLKKYHYRVPESLKGSLKKGDVVVVHCSTGYQICEVFSVNVITSYDPSTLAPVVCKVDINSYMEEVSRKKKLEYLKLKIEKEKKRLESMITYDLIAEKNPEFKELLQSYKDLGGEF